MAVKQQRGAAKGRSGVHDEVSLAVGDTPLVAMPNLESSRE
jgi:hypothetical protein